MALRHTTIDIGADDMGEDTAQNQACYKCPVCAWFIRFFIIDDKWYCEKVLKWRDGDKSLVPTVSDWSKESDEIKRQLESLGYWGGN